SEASRRLRHDCDSRSFAVNIPLFSVRVSMRLLLFVALLSFPSVPTFAEDSGALLHKLTQTFSDAGQQGDGPGMARLLDPNVIFFNETGEKATRADMAGGGAP